MNSGHDHDQYVRTETYEEAISKKESRIEELEQRNENLSQQLREAQNESEAVNQAADDNGAGLTFLAATGGFGGIAAYAYLKLALDEE